MVDMSERGIMEIARNGDEFQIRMSEDARAQFADSSELYRLKAAEERFPSSSAGGTVASMRDALRFPGMPGIDRFSRQVGGWSLRSDMMRDSAIDALRMACFKRHPAKQAGWIFHSDRGSQYASHDFRAELAAYGITSSMSRKGNCWDTRAARRCSGH